MNKKIIRVEDYDKVIITTQGKKYRIATYSNFAAMIVTVLLFLLLYGIFHIGADSSGFSFPIMFASVLLTVLFSQIFKLLGKKYVPNYHDSSVLLGPIPKQVMMVIHEADASDLLSKSFTCGGIDSEIIHLLALVYSEEASTSVIEKSTRNLELEIQFAKQREFDRKKSKTENDLALAFKD